MTQTSSKKSSASKVTKLDSSAPRKLEELSSLNESNNSSSLRRQLLLTLLPTALIPLLIAGGLGYQNVQDKETTRIKNQLEDQALLTGEIALQTISEAQKIPATIANNPLIIQTIKNTNAEITAQNLLSLPPVEVETKYQQNKLIVVNQQLNNYLQKTVNETGLGSLLLTERNGFNVAYSNSVSKLRHQDQSWWQQAKNKNQAVNSTDTTYGLLLSQSIKDPDSGAFLGVIQASLPARRFNLISNSLRKSGLTGSQVLQILIPSKQQEIITINSEENKSNQPILGAEELTKLGEAMIKIVAEPTLITEMDLTKFTSDAKIKANLTPIYEQNGEEILLASFVYQGREYSIATIPRTNWIASSSMEIKEINAAGSALISVFGLIEIVLLIIVTGIILAVANNLSQPLVELSAIAEEVALGNLDVQVKPVGTMETRTLAETFNKLITRVRNLLQTQERATQEALLLADLSSSEAKDEKDQQLFLTQSLDKVREYLQADRVVIYRFNRDKSGYIAQESVAENWPSALSEDFTDPCISEELLQAYQNNRTVATNDVLKAGFHPDHLALMQRLQIKSNLVVPIISQKQLLGLLIVNHCAVKHIWENYETKFLQEVATQLQIVQDRVTFLTQIEEAKQQAEKMAQQQQQLKEEIQRRALELLMEVDPVSKGDLTIRATVTEDEIGTLADSYNATIQSLNKIVTQVKKASQQVNNTTTNNEILVQDLFALSQQQTEEMNLALSKIQAMTQSIALVTENAETAQISVEQANKTVKIGDQVMNRTVESILAISDTVSDTAEKVRALGESSLRISKVVKLIGSFASQTNLLALNASIEAAHAGDQGLGFAVVAEEVRSLASQSAKATAEIAALVDEIQQETQTVVKAMEEGTEQVLQGTFLVEEARNLLSQISESSLKTSQLVEAIAQAASQQFQDSEIVDQTMNDAASIAYKTSVSAKNVSKSFEELLTVSRELQTTVDKFKIN